MNLSMPYKNYTKEQELSYFFLMVKLNILKLDVSSEKQSIKVSSSSSFCVRFHASMGWTDYKILLQINILYKLRYNIINNLGRLILTKLLEHVQQYNLIRLSKGMHKSETEVGGGWVDS